MMNSKIVIAFLFSTLIYARGAYYSRTRSKKNSERRNQFQSICRSKPHHISNNCNLKTVSKRSEKETSSENVWCGKTTGKDMDICTSKETPNKPKPSLMHSAFEKIEDYMERAFCDGEFDEKTLKCHPKLSQTPDKSKKTNQPPEYPRCNWVHGRDYLKCDPIGPEEVDTPAPPSKVADKSPSRPELQRDSYKQPDLTTQISTKSVHHLPKVFKPNLDSTSFKTATCHWFENLKSTECDPKDICLSNYVFCTQ
ncbi:hypothetical protein DSO57_1034521 [Entomophthora muscae]|uniref:Uncharacterized protein n=1 Tax=Entomophthora muscae TaxID=34485 RepID=A0ACC2S213_9FUNG|nr:hypothetical protein DSO57_1034521 [Entomophthora muscae]